MTARAREGHDCNRNLPARSYDLLDSVQLEVESAKYQSTGHGMAAKVTKRVCGLVERNEPG